MSATKDFKPTSKPSHRAYALTTDHDDACLTEIGFAHQHWDGKGCEIRLDTGSLIVLRPIAEPVSS